MQSHILTSLIDPQNADERHLKKVKDQAEHWVLNSACPADKPILGLRRSRGRAAIGRHL